MSEVIRVRMYCTDAAELAADALRLADVAWHSGSKVIGPEKPTTSELGEDCWVTEFTIDSPESETIAALRNCKPADSVALRITLIWFGQDPTQGWTDSEGARNRSMIWHELGEQARAIHEMSRAIRFAPRDPDLFNSRGYLHSLLDESENAMADYDEAIRLDSYLAIAWVNRGNEWLKRGDSDRAEADFAQARALGYTE